MGLRPVDGFAWEKALPKPFSIATGRFDETSPGPEGPKLRPLLITRVLRRKADGLVLCRVFYGTTQKLHLAKPEDLYIQSASLLDQLCLLRATRFILSDVRQCMFLPWQSNYFEPWDDKETPVRSVLPEDMRRFAEFSIARLEPLPMPPLK